MLLMRGGARRHVARSGAVDLWTLPCMGAGASAAGAALLSAEERMRCARRLIEPDLRRCHAACAGLRRVLAQYSEVPPQGLQLQRDTQGKPQLQGRTPPLYFNLAHTRGLMACAVSGLHQRLGVDAERHAPRGDALALAARYFTPEEAQRLEALPPLRRDREFLRYWTLKEAFVKAQGQGLRLSLRLFSFDLDQPGEIRVRFDPALRESAANWRFRQWQLGPWSLALAVDTGGLPLDLRRCHRLPLAPAEKCADVDFRR